MVAFAVALVIISFARTVSAAVPPYARDELVNLGKELREYTLQATENIKKANDLVRSIRTMVENLRLSSNNRGHSNEIVDDLIAFERKVDESRKKGNPKMTQIFRNSNTLAIEINQILDDENEDALLPKIQEAKQVLEQNKNTLGEITRQYEELVKEFKMKGNASARDTAYGGNYENYNHMPHQGDANGSQWQYREHEGVNLSPEPTEDELRNLLESNKIPKFSRDDFITIATALGRLLNKTNKKFNKDERVMTNMLDRTRNMFKKALSMIEKADEFQNTERLHIEYQRFVKYKDEAEGLYRISMETIGNIKEDKDLVIKRIETLIAELAHFGNDVPIENDLEKVYIRLCKEILIKIGEIREKTLDFSSKSTKIHGIFESVKHFFNLVEVYYDKLIFERMTNNAKKQNTQDKKSESQNENKPSEPYPRKSEIPADAEKENAEPNASGTFSENVSEPDGNGNKMRNDDPEDSHKKHDEIHKKPEEEQMPKTSNDHSNYPVKKAKVRSNIASESSVKDEDYKEEDVNIQDDHERIKETKEPMRLRNTNETDGTLLHGFNSVIFVMICIALM
ncbi:signal peptide containing protein [Theileria equi strain WA]|uniref:Signal peptide containing protein n=1 Tax=Theileria equi strain WA TaxID=1537102 RepID=L1LBN5_THEEQ|nr:signal peptide containing protein [Theileria equi strain WA]EKX72832.1 signal peptide containing protein [Theileria equi strain WA]|eukprot:XP_004832284.1 signal peptide containing protein [Theileria equi strain WA]